MGIFLDAFTSGITDNLAALLDNNIGRIAFKTTVKDSRFAFIKVIKLINANITDEYYIKYFYKHDVGNRVTIRVHNSAGTEVARYYEADRTVFPSTLEKVELAEFGSSGISGYAIVDWASTPASLSATAFTVTTGGIAKDATQNANASIDLKTQNAIFEASQSIKSSVVVDKNGSGSYTTLTAAYVAYENICNFENQIEFIVMPGVYSNEAQGLQPPKFSTTKARFQGTVLVIQTAIDGDSGTHASVFDPVNSCKIKGINIRCESSDMYTIHTAAPLNSLCIYENCNISHSKSDQWCLAGDGNGNTHKFIGCNIQSNYYSLQHSAPQTGDNYASRLEFIGCSMPSTFSLDSLGCTNNSVMRIENSILGKIQYNYNKYNNSLNVNNHPADNREWIVIGGGNKNVYFDFNAAGEHLAITTANVNEQITISGTAVVPLFGVNYKTLTGGTRIKGAILSQGDVRDVQVGGYPVVTLYNLIQMWYRLGNCSVVNKTLSVTVGATTETYTFNLNYTSANTEASLLTALNAFFTICDFSKVNAVANYDKVLLAEKKTIYVGDAGGILKDEFIMLNSSNQAVRATQGLNYRAVAGIAVEDKVTGEFIQCWAGAFEYISANGEYGIGADNKLSAAESTKIGYVKDNVFYPYY